MTDERFTQGEGGHRQLSFHANWSRPLFPVTRKKKGKGEQTRSPMKLSFFEGGRKEIEPISVHPGL